MKSYMTCYEIIDFPVGQRMPKVPSDSIFRSSGRAASAAALTRGSRSVKRLRRVGRSSGCPQRPRRVAVLAPLPWFSYVFMVYVDVWAASSLEAILCYLMLCLYLHGN